LNWHREQHGIKYPTIKRLTLYTIKRKGTGKIWQRMHLLATDRTIYELNGKKCQDRVDSALKRLLHTENQKISYQKQETGRGIIFIRQLITKNTKPPEILNGNAGVHNINTTY